MKTWREKATPIIAAVIAANAGKPEKDVRAALRAAYPWGPREYHPYKIWCSEVKRQLNPNTEKRAVQIKAVSEHLASSPGQLAMFQEVGEGGE